MTFFPAFCTDNFNIVNEHVINILFTLIEAFRSQDSFSFYLMCCCCCCCCLHLLEYTQKRDPYWSYDIIIAHNTTHKCFTVLSDCSHCNTSSNFSFVLGFMKLGSLFNVVRYSESYGTRQHTKNTHTICTGLNHKSRII